MYSNIIEKLTSMGISKEEYQEAAKKESAPDISLMTIKAPSAAEAPRLVS